MTNIVPDGYSLNVPFNRSGQPEFESSYITYREILLIEFPTRLFESEGITAVSTSKAWEISYLVATLNPKKE